MPRRACSSETSAARLTREGTSARARECPRVTQRLRHRHPSRRFAGAFVKPSDGLEPSTPSLPFSFDEGSKGTRGSRRPRKPRKPTDSPKSE